MWRYAPKGDVPHKTICNRFVHWSRLGVFTCIFSELAGRAEEPGGSMIDVTHLKAHRTASSHPKGGLPRCVAHTKGALDSKLRTICNGQGRPITMLLTEGQMSNHKGAALLFLRRPSSPSSLLPLP